MLVAFHQTSKTRATVYRFTTIPIHSWSGLYFFILKKVLVTRAPCLLTRVAVVLALFFSEVNSVKKTDKTLNFYQSFRCNIDA